MSDENHVERRLAYLGYQLTPCDKVPQLRVPSIQNRCLWLGMPICHVIPPFGPRHWCHPDRLARLQLVHSSYRFHRAALSMRHNRSLAPNQCKPGLNKTILFFIVGWTSESNGLSFLCPSAAGQSFLCTCAIQCDLSLCIRSL